MALAVVDQFVPEYGGTLVWSLHNQLALCTPRIIHLFLPFVDANGSVSFKRGHITYEMLLGGDEGREEGEEGDGRDYGIAEETLSVSISWNARRRANKGFRMICCDRLAILLFSGEVVLLECSSSRFDDGRLWERACVPEIETLSNQPATYICCEGNSELLIATENSKLHCFYNNGHCSTDLPLRVGEVVCSLSDFKGQKLLCTSSGRILQQNDGLWTAIVDDRVLQVGPTLRLAQGTVLTKFNRVYWLFGGAVRTIVIPNLLLPIAGILLPSEDSIMVLGMDGTVHKVDMNTGTVCFLPAAPWTAASSTGIDANGESESEDEASSELDSLPVVEEEESRVFHAVAVSQDKSIAWIVETEYRRYPLLPKSRLYLYKMGGGADYSEKVSDQLLFVMKYLQKKLPSIETSQAIETIHAAFKDDSSTRGRWEMSSDFKRSIGKCVVCKGAVFRREMQPMLCSCERGHFFDLCCLTLAPLSQITEALQCHRCERKASRYASKKTLNRCPYCSGTFLAMIR